MDEEIKFRRNITLDIPSGLSQENGAISIVGLEVNAAVTMNKDAEKILISLPDGKDGDSVAINISGKNENGTFTSDTYLLRYTSLNGWQQESGSIAKRLNSF